MIFPAIDLREGKCVRLVEGKKENQTVYSDSPAEMAAHWEAQGAEFLHVVDLDGAFTGSPQNLAAIQEIAAAIKIPFQVGGGIRTRETVKTYLDLGAARVIIGTRAVVQPGFMAELIADFGADKIVLGLDAKDGQVAIEGWVEKTDRSATAFGREIYELGVRTAIYTDVARDGKLAGPNLEATAWIARETGLKIIASGGVSRIDDLRNLQRLQPDGVIGAIIGKAIYDGKLTLKEALAAVQEG